MTAVQDADFHQFISSDLISERDTDFFQCRTPSGEIVLHHPLLENFTENRPPVFNSEILRSDFTLACTGSWRDAIHHGIRKSDIGGNPVGKSRITQLGQSCYGIFRHMPITRNVIARHDGERLNTRRLAQFQCLHD